MGKWQQLTIILAFTLLLAAGLNYTGRSMHHVLGGDKKYYTFLLPDLNQHQVVFCGRSYAEYQVENLWGRQKAALDDLWQAVPLAFLKQVLSVLKGCLGPVWLYLTTLATELHSLMVSLLGGRLAIPLP